MATFQDLQNEVSANIIDLPPRVPARVAQRVNAAIHRIQRRHNFKCMEAELSLTTNEEASPANLLTAAVPALFKELRGKPYEVNSQGKARALEVISLRDAIERYGADTGMPQVLVEMGIDPVAYTRTLYLFPAPDGASLYDDGEYRIKVPYYSYTAALSGSADTNWFVENAYDYIVKSASAEGFGKNWDYEGMQVWATLAKGEEQDVILRDKRERLGAMPTLTISPNAR